MWENGGGGTFLNEIWDSDDDVLLQAISAATLWWRDRRCLNMSASCYTVSVLGLHTLWNGLQNSEKDPNVKQSSGPLPHAGPMWAAVENNSMYKNHRGFAVVSPPMDRNLRSRQECARAWSWLSSEQISMRRQVCSACPHSCSCLLANCFCYLLRATFTMWCVVKDECWRKIPMCEVSPWTLLFIVLI